MPQRASTLRFGDFDGDRRTDVLVVDNGRIAISWAGGSSWQTINTTAWGLSDLAVGDFDGDQHADLFLATGTAWFVAPRARNWAPYSTQPRRTTDLRFGDLTRDGKTDVVAMMGGRWRMLTRHGGVEHWVDLHQSLSGSLAGVVVADFNGDGYADLARSRSGSWWLSSAGVNAWSELRSATVPGYGIITDLTGYPIGRFFDGNSTADIAFPSGTTGVHFDYAPGGLNPVTRLSRQAMK